MLINAAEIGIKFIMVQDMFQFNIYYIFSLRNFGEPLIGHIQKGEKINDLNNILQQFLCHRVYFMPKIIQKL